MPTLQNTIWLTTSENSVKHIKYIDFLLKLLKTTVEKNTTCKNAEYTVDSLQILPQVTKKRYTKQTNKQFANTKYSSKADIFFLKSSVVQT